MNYDAMIEQLRAWADAVQAVTVNTPLPPTQAAQMVVVILGMRETADDLEREAG